MKWRQRRPRGAADVGGAPNGGMSDVAADVLAAGANAGGAGGAGPVAPLPDFAETFDTTLGRLSIHPDGFSPGPGGSLGPPIFDMTTLTFDAGTGNPGGAAKITVPFTVPSQQADFAGTFATPFDLTGYELVADVKLTGVGRWRRVRQRLALRVRCQRLRERQEG